MLGVSGHSVGPGKGLDTRNASASCGSKHQGAAGIKGTRGICPCSLTSSPAEITRGLRTTDWVGWQWYVADDIQIGQDVLGSDCVPDLRAANRVAPHQSFIFKPECLHLF